MQQSQLSPADRALLSARQHLSRASDLLGKASETSSNARATDHIEEARVSARRALRELGDE